MTTRERYIAIGVGAVVGLYVLDSFLIEPLVQRQTEARQADARATQELQDAEQLATNRLRAQRVWKNLAGETLKTDQKSAESQLVNFVGDQVRAAGLSLDQLKTDQKPEKEGDFFQLNGRVGTTGTMAQQARFLNALRTANIPVRITDLQINSRKDGIDDLSLQAGIATIFATPLEGARADASSSTNKPEATQ